MQPSDQEELRRRAQQAMQRRRSKPSEGRAEEPQRPQQLERDDRGPRSEVQRQRDAGQVRELQRQLERERQQSPREPAPELEQIEVLDTPEEPVARAERRDLSAEVERPEARVRTRRRPARDIYAGAYTRSDLVNQRSQIYQDLHDRDAVRRAFVMMEVLGKPVALRDQGGPSSPTTE